MKESILKIKEATKSELDAALDLKTLNDIRV